VYRRFAFEGDIHVSLECVPLAVRRKLDLATLKISLQGWQSLPRADRLTLCHLPVDNQDEIDIYREVMRACCEREGVALVPLDDVTAAARAWNALRTPQAVSERLQSLGVLLPDDDWQKLDEEVRYCLLKLADPKRKPEKLPALLVELGLMAGPAPVLKPDVVVCETAVATTAS
jgi:hypothetical protein